MLAFIESPIPSRIASAMPKKSSESKTDERKTGKVRLG